MRLQMRAQGQQKGVRSEEVQSGGGAHSSAATRRSTSTADSASPS